MFALLVTLTHGRRAKLKTITKEEADAIAGLLSLNPDVKNVEVKAC